MVLFFTIHVLGDDSSYVFGSWWVRGIQALLAGGNADKDIGKHY